MKEIVVISGKGGTGKTSLSASFAYLEKDNAIIADCDVDAANMHLLLKADFDKAEDFFSGESAFINASSCRNCGACARVCRFDAIKFDNAQFVVDSIACEGCGYCSFVCKKGAIQMRKQKSGDFYLSNTKVGSCLAHAKLGFGAENSGKLVSFVKNEAKKIAKEQNKEFVIVDGSPGIGCPVISSLSGAKLVVLVTEASVSGFHDLQRIYEVVNSFHIKAVCIINKYDLNPYITEDIEEFLKQNDIELITRLPYDESFTEALSEAKCIVENENYLCLQVKDAWNKIKKEV